jgi:hypothetical protein
MIYEEYELMLMCIFSVITLYSGLPGSGKSYHATQRMVYNLTKRKKTVISNSNIRMDVLTKNGKLKTGKFIYIESKDLTVDWLENYARENHDDNKEGQALVVIEEAWIKFQARKFMEADRDEWLEFFATHRKYGYDFILVSQKDRQIDRQIRDCIEYDVRHKAANNFKGIGAFLTVIRVKMFIAVKYWYQERLRDSSETFYFKKKIGKLYNTMEKYNTKQLKQDPPPVSQINAHRSAQAQNAPRRVWDGTAQAVGAYARQERQSASAHHQCATKSCATCKAHSICKMPWKHLPPYMKGNHYDARGIFGVNMR